MEGKAASTSFTLLRRLLSTTGSCYCCWCSVDCYDRLGWKRAVGDNVSLFSAISVVFLNVLHLTEIEDGDL